MIADIVVSNKRSAFKKFGDFDFLCFVGKSVSNTDFSFNNEVDLRDFVVFVIYDFGFFEAPRHEAEGDLVEELGVSVFKGIEELPESKENVLKQVVYHYRSLYRARQCRHERVLLRYVRKPVIRPEKCKMRFYGILLKLFVIVWKS